MLPSVPAVNRSMRERHAYVKFDVGRPTSNLTYLNRKGGPVQTSDAMAESLEVRLGKRCRKLRHQAGLSQLDMARDHGFSLSHYQKIERGTLDPRLSTLSKIAKCFGVSLS